MHALIWIQIMLIWLSPATHLILLKYWMDLEERGWWFWQKLRYFHPNQVCLLRLRTVTSFFLKFNPRVDLLKTWCLRNWVKSHHFLYVQTPAHNPAHWPSPCHWAHLPLLSPRALSPSPPPLFWLIYHPLHPYCPIWAAPQLCSSVC